MTRRMDLRRLAQAGERLAAARAQEAAELEVILDEVDAAGALRNVELAARLAGVTKRTIYQGLKRRRENAGAAATTTTKDPTR